MPLTKLMIVGGFLGAGKTTSILALARSLTAAGNKVGIVTNDQGSHLVDTEYLHSQGFPVLEVTGGCFCCNFDQFAAKLAELQTLDYPDYVLAEPVGSCTDLIATLMKPLKHHHDAEVALAPLSVVVDPKRLRRYMRDQDSLFPNEVNYLFNRQLTEADLIILNKADTLEDSEIREMTAFLKTKYRGIEVLALSAKTGDGLPDWLGQLAANRPATVLEPSMAVDYDIYARAEAALGWLNTTATLAVLPPTVTCALCAESVDANGQLIPSSVVVGEAQPVDGNAFVNKLLNQVKDQLAAGKHEIAHLKAYIVAGCDWAKASCVSLAENVEFDHQMSIGFTTATLVLNCRAAIDPDLLRQICEQAIKDQTVTAAIHIESLFTEAFQPSYPKPIYRMA